MNNDKPKIYFILNTLGLTGGVKVIFEHANILNKKGYEVNLIHLLKLQNTPHGFIVAILKKIKYLVNNNKRPNWFDLKKEIKIERAINLSNLNLGKNDIIIATANETADFVNALNHAEEKKYYYVQDYETWTRKKELVDKTYAYKLKKIAVCKSLKDDIEKKLNQNFIGIAPAGIDYNFFKCENKTFSDKIKILMLYHPLPKKGFKDGLEAVRLLKKVHPEVELLVFGAYQKLEENIIDKYYYKPSQEQLRKLYHEANIFLYPALEEGFGLTLLEAAAAGCALVTTRVGWTREYGIDQSNLIFINKTDPQNTYNTLSDLVKNQEKSLQLGNEVSKIAKDFTWENSNNKLEYLLLN